jgi:hypothetical protein
MWACKASGVDRNHRRTGYTGLNPDRYIIERHCLCAVSESVRAPNSSRSLAIFAAALRTSTKLSAINRVVLKGKVR